MSIQTDPVCMMQVDEQTAAGALKVPFGAFSAWVIVGKAMRYFAVAWATRTI